jgi:CRP-like cAMP-binding protein
VLADLCAQIPPFDFLTPAEVAWLAEQVQEAGAPEQTILCDPEDADFDEMYIVSEGRIAVYLPGGYAGPPAQVRSAPTYFGEISVFFDQPRNARVTAYTPLKYYRINGEMLRTLVRQNPLFSLAFASSLRNKQRIFHGFEAFMGLVTTQEAQGVVQLSDLIESYRGLRSVLHRTNEEHRIDFDALAYVLPRLPDHITSLFVLHLVEDLPEAYMQVQDTLQATSRRAKKRRFYTLLPGKCLVLLRERFTDTVDLLTKLCIFEVEMAKIRRRLQGHPVTNRIAEMAVSNLSQRAAEAVWDELPFSAEEIKQLQVLFGGDLFARLYEIMVQDGQMILYFAPARNRYVTSASERWRSQIRDGLERTLRASGQPLSAYDVHIISGNEHSVANCLSRWLQEHAETILSWGRQHVPETLGQKDATDELYAAARDYLKAHPDMNGRRILADEAQGIFVLDDTSFAGISVTLVDMLSLGKGLDPGLGQPQTERPTLIVSIDYAYGRQAELIMQNLILLFGRQIRSVSVFGKSGAVVGQRGDLLVADRFLMQATHELYTVPNNDLTSADFHLDRPVHTGTLLTVLGTVMQSNEMLRYYQTFWQVVGMEMEGSYYLRELLQAHITGMIDPEVKMRFAYYTSDTPLESDSSLAAKLSAQDGVPAVYAITRAILRRILRGEP